MAPKLLHRLLKKPSPDMRPVIKARHFLYGLIFLAVLVMGERIINLFSGADKPLVTQVQAELADDKAKPLASESQAHDKKADDTKEGEKKPTAAAAVKPDDPQAKVTDKQDDKKPDQAKGKDDASAPEASQKTENQEDIKTKEAMEAAEAAEKVRASNSERELSEGERDTLEQLGKRRTMLDEREKKIGQKEALLKATEKRLADKFKEMEELRQTLSAMLGQVSEQKAADLENLVKIYAAMKPAEAARIFSQMELPSLLQVISRMKPTQAGPILAAMDPARAKEISTALTEKSDLPDTPQP
ncbi:MAG: hypothetical protein EBQ89_10255 [Alphaproteobacteria bacterium]|nr:hypothetical protein [Alphaproteobacteria bacterium]